jgi:PASTA domain
MNRVDVRATVARPQPKPRRARRGSVGELVPVVAVAATLVVALLTAPHTTDALIHPMALSTQDSVGITPTDRVPGRVEVPDLRGMTFQLARETTMRAGLDVVALVNHVPTSDLRQADHVVAQDPTPLTAADRGTAVQLGLGVLRPQGPAASAAAGPQPPEGVKGYLFLSNGAPPPVYVHVERSRGTVAEASRIKLGDDVRILCEWTAAGQKSLLIIDHSAALRGWVSADDAFPTAPPSGCALPLPAQPGVDPTPIA